MSATKSGAAKVPRSVTQLAKRVGLPYGYKLHVKQGPDGAWFGKVCISPGGVSHRFDLGKCASEKAAFDKLTLKARAYVH